MTTNLFEPPRRTLLRDLLSDAVLPLISAWAVAVTITSVIRLVANGMRQDFAWFYWSSIALLKGRPMYQYPNLNPPHFAFVTLPFTAAPLGWALAAWAATMVICLTVSSVIVSRELHWRPTVRDVCMMAASAPIALALATGQNTWILVLGMTLGWRALRHNRQTEAGIWFALVTSIKPFLWPLGLWFILRRMWRPLTAWIITGAVVLSAGIAICGAQAYRDWFTTGGFVAWYEDQWNVSILGLASRLARTGRVPVHNMPLLVACLTVLGAIGLLALSLWRRRAPDVELGPVILAACLASPLAEVYYVALALGPVIARLRKKLPAWSPILLLFLWSAGSTWLSNNAPVWTIPLRSRFFIATVALWMICLDDGSRQAGGPAGDRRRLRQAG